MSFGIQMEQRGSHGRVRPAGNATGPLTALAIAFVIFCVYDYSPYGHGFVAAFLGDAQRWFQAFVRSFRLKM
jgi:hypothetical protein